MMLNYYIFDLHIYHMIMIMHYYNVYMQHQNYFVYVIINHKQIQLNHDVIYMINCSYLTFPYILYQMIIVNLIALLLMYNYLNPLNIKQIVNVHQHYYNHNTMIHNINHMLSQYFHFSYILFLHFHAIWIKIDLFDSLNHLFYYFSYFYYFEHFSYF